MILKVGLFSLLFVLIHASAAVGSPVLGVDENIDEEDFYSDNYTNPDSLQTHDIATNATDSEYSQIKINDEFKPRETVSPDGNFTVYMKALNAARGVGIEDYVLYNNVTGLETKIPGIATMGYYAVAFSPDSKMYAAPMIVSCDEGRNCQYSIDIVSAETNEVLHTEMLPFYKENTKYTPMDWDRSGIYGIYWSEDGDAIVYEVLGADIDGGNYPTTMVMNRLNVNYTELREMNGYVEPAAEFAGEVNGTEEPMRTMPLPQDPPQEEAQTTSDETEAMAAPGFGALASLISVAALVAIRKFR